MRQLAARMDLAQALVLRNFDAESLPDPAVVPVPIPMPKPKASGGDLVAALSDTLMVLLIGIAAVVNVLRACPTWRWCQCPSPSPSPSPRRVTSGWGAAGVLLRRCTRAVWAVSPLRLLWKGGSTCGLMYCQTCDMRCIPSPSCMQRPAGQAKSTWQAPTALGWLCCACGSAAAGPDASPPASPRTAEEQQEGSELGEAEAQEAQVADAPTQDGQPPAEGLEALRAGSAGAREERSAWLKQLQMATIGGA